MKNRLLVFLVMTGVLILTGAYSVNAWPPVPVRTDPNLFMPGSQPGQGGTTDAATRCDNCHGGYNTAVESAFNWRGSMMAQAHRDPLELAPFTMTLQDSIWATGNPNAGDICIKCHTPLGWLEGRSDPTNGTALTGTDYDGVQCDFCHRMIDPFAKLMQPGVPAETDPIAISMANETYNKDIGILGTLYLFDGTTPFLNSTTLLPTYYGNGLLPNYVEAGSGQIFMDPSSAKSGPYYDANAKHKMYYSRYTKSKYFCITCHDVSNPVLANLTSPGLTERQAAATYFHIERTGSEFLLSAYGRGDGAPTNIPGVPIADKCQDCHMRDVTGKGCKLSGVATRTDLALHDFSGGNQWMTKILASADPGSPNYDPYNYAILSGAKYSAMIDVGGLQGVGPALLAGSGRAVQQLQMAATLSVVSETTSAVTLKVQNNTGHKLTSGFPEGRRMFLNVKFYDSAGALISEMNPYAPLVTAKNAQGNDVYVSGGTLRKDRDDLVWEAEMSSSLTGEAQTFHVALATDRWKDNRIPPKGFDTAHMNERLSQPRWNGADAPNYFTPAEYAGGYDEVTVSKPTGAASWNATLYYQTTNREFVEFMRDEINGTGTPTLTSPTPSGEPQAYIIQTDPFFATLKGWGYALWDLWLHNGGAAPVVMASAGMSPPSPCVTPGTPQSLTATGGQRKVVFNWTAGSPAPTGGYNVYYDQAGKVQYKAGVSAGTTTYTDSGLNRATQYCYRVTAWNDCNGNGVYDAGIDVESSVSNIACATTN